MYLRRTGTAVLPTAEREKSTIFTERQKNPFLQPAPIAAEAAPKELVLRAAAIDLSNYAGHDVPGSAAGRNGKTCSTDKLSSSRTKLF